MSLEIEKQETESRELKLIVRVDETRVEESMRTTAKKMAKNLRIPGFRPGKAPYHIVRNWVGKEALRAETVDALTQEVYQEAIEQVQATPYAPGSLDDVEMEPLVLHLTIPLPPHVELGDYREVRVEPSTVEVNDEAVNNALEIVQAQHTLLEPADRPCQEGDVVIADLKSTKGDEILIDREGAELLLDPEKLYPDTPFVENVIGMQAGDEKSFEVESASEDDEEETQNITYTVKVHEVKSRYVPPLDDDLALEEGFDSLLDMRIDTRSKLTEEAQNRADGEYANKVFEAILEGATVQYPAAATGFRMEQRIEEMERRFQQQNWKLDDYLRAQGKTRDMLREELLPDVEKELIRSEVTRELIEMEELQISGKDIDLIVEERLAETEEMGEEMRQQLTDAYKSPEARNWLANDALMTKFTERLRAIGQGIAPELGLEEEE